MSDQELPDPNHPSGQLIADMQAELAQLHARVAHLEQVLTSLERVTTSNNKIGTKQWFLLGAVLVLCVLISALATDKLFATSYPTSGLPSKPTSITNIVAPDATAQTVQATVTALAQGATRLYGPNSNELVHRSDNIIQTKFTYVAVQNFILEATFSNPYEPGAVGWDYGFMFRRTKLLNEYRLYVTSDQEWSLRLLEIPTIRGTPSQKAELGGQVTPTITPLPASAEQIVAGGAIDNLDTSGNGSNHLRVVAKDGTAYFFVNDKYVATLDISAKLDTGDILVGTSFRVKDHKSGAVTRYSNLSIWKLP